MKQTRQRSSRNVSSMRITRTSCISKINETSLLVRKIPIEQLGAIKSTLDQYNTVLLQLDLLLKESYSIIPDSWQQKLDFPERSDEMQRRNSDVSEEPLQLELACKPVKDNLLRLSTLHQEMQDLSIMFEHFKHLTTSQEDRLGSIERALQLTHSKAEESENHLKSAQSFLSRQNALRVVTLGGCIGAAALGTPALLFAGTSKTTLKLIDRQNGFYGSSNCRSSYWRKHCQMGVNSITG